MLVMIRTVSIDSLVNDPKTGQRRNERLGAWVLHVLLAMWMVDGCEQLI